MRRTVMCIAIRQLSSERLRFHITTPYEPMLRTTFSLPQSGTSSFAQPLPFAVLYTYRAMKYA